MRLLLDAHALIWWLADDPELTDGVREAVTDGTNLVAVSAVTAWELAIKHALGKLDMPDDLEAQVVAEGFVALPVTLADGLVAGRLPRYHGDPFDRMLIAQAQSGNYTIVTRDASFGRYGVHVLKA